MLLLTNGGRDLLARTVAGETGIVFTKVQRGNGSDQGRTATALGNSLLEVGISSYEINVDGTITLHWNYNNANVFSGFRATELGIFAVEDEDDADDPTAQILFAYEYCPSADADYVPANSSGRIVTTSFDTDVYIGDATDVSVVISESSIYATKAELDALADEVDNLGPSDVGLGNVPNVSTNEQTPTYTVAQTLSNLVSGEHLSIAFSKISKAISSLIDHIANRSNPHGVTATQIGAAAEDHTHGASDISSGVLSIERGGTGNIDGAAQKLYSARLLRVNLESSDAVTFNGTQNADNIGTSGVLPIHKGGTGRVDGHAIALANKRQMKVNLASTSYAEFDGTANVDLGVDGVLPLRNGGTGVTTLAELQALVGSGGGGSADLSAHLADYNNPHQVSAAQIGAAAANHSHTAASINAGTLAGKVLANAAAQQDLAASQIRNIYAGTARMTAGETALPTGTIYLVYEE